MVPMPFCFPRKEAKQCPSLLTVVLLPNKKVLCLFLKSLFAPLTFLILSSQMAPPPFAPRAASSDQSTSDIISPSSARARFLLIPLSRPLSLSLSLSLSSKEGPNDHTFPSIWTRRFNFGATAKPPRSDKEGTVQTT